MGDVALGRGGDVVARFGATRSPILPGEVLGVARGVGAYEDVWFDEALVHLSRD